MISRIFYRFTSQFALMAIPIAAAAAQSSQASIRYDLVLRLLPVDHRIEGTASLTLPRAEQLADLQLDGDVAVRSVTADGRNITFFHENGRLVLTGLSGRHITRLSIDYTATFNDPLPRETVGVEDPSFGVSASINPEGVYLAGGVAWFPQVAGRSGTHRLQVSAPFGTVAVSAGRFSGAVSVNGTTVSTWENDFPLAGLSLAAGPYQVLEKSHDGIQLLTFFTDDNAALAPDYLAAIHRHLDFYQDLLGPYPFAKFAVVENFLPTGYGLPSWTLIGKSVIRLPFLLDTSLPHEIVHSWWGNAVEVDYTRGNWAEGLATYLADYLLKEQAPGSEAFEYRRKILRDYATLVTEQNEFPLKDFSGRMARYQQAIGYGKGAMVFHMLRGEIGDAAFRKGLRGLAALGNGDAVGWDDIDRVFSEVSGADLHWFFTQWVERSGAPRLALEEVRSTPAGNGWKVSGVIRQHGTPYRLKLPLQLLEANGNWMKQTVPLQGARTPFLISVKTRPELLEADPGSDLFRRLSPAELPATVNGLTTPQRPLVVIAEGQQALHAATQDLLKGLHWEDAEIVAEETVASTTLVGRDVLFLGWPRQSLLQPPLPSELNVSTTGRTDRWSVTGQDLESDVIFAVLHKEDTRSGHCALFMAKTPAAALAVARKIPHYGRYSLLLFKSGSNVFKITWEPDSSPLKTNFAKEIRL